MFLEYSDLHDAWDLLGFKLLGAHFSSHLLLFFSAHLLLFLPREPIQLKYVLSIVNSLKIYLLGIKIYRFSCFISESYLFPVVCLFASMG